jgi:pyrroline-5-carboxylate reductase
MAAALGPQLRSDAFVVSAMAGVPAHQVAAAFAGRRIARAMPTLAVAVLKGATAVWAAEAAATERAAALFAPLGAVVVLAEEDQLHAVTAASGSAPAYLYAVIEAVEAAARAQGVAADAAAALARGAIIGAAALLADSGEDPAKLRARVTSPGGTTEAAMAVLLAVDGLPALMQRAVAAATVRSRELAP